MTVAVAHQYSGKRLNVLLYASVLNIMGVSKGIELRFTVSLFGFYAPATG